jgi:hypothetical protein
MRKITTEHLHGVSDNTLIRLINSSTQSKSTKPAREIVIGDVLEDGGIVTGIATAFSQSNMFATVDSQLVSRGVIMENINRIPGVITSPEYRWLPAAISNTYEVMETTAKTIYMFETTTGKIPIGVSPATGTYIRDLRGTDNKAILEENELEILIEIQGRSIPSRKN